MTKILVIEDETPILENIVEILEFEGGFEVIQADNGLAGLQQAQAHLPDLIVCDITMPEMDGYSVLLEVRKIPEMAATPFIFLTARADRAFLRHAMELGADDYLTKPFSAAELMAAVIARLERHETTTRALEKQVEEAKQQLVQMVAHELRTPLVSITMTADIISHQISQLSPHRVQELLGYINRGSERLYRLVEQMVFLTQLKAGVLTKTTVLEDGLLMPISEMVVAAIDLARRFAARHPDVAIRLDAQDGNVVVHVDSASFKQALAELITNAINFSPEGDEVVILQWAAEGYVWIEIVDHGPGIPAAQLERAQEEFQQIDRQVQEQQGMGMGLFLAHQIIEAHGGSLDIKSVVGRGTQVIVRLPVAADM